MMARAAAAKAALAAEALDAFLRNRSRPPEPATSTGFAKPGASDTVSPLAPNGEPHLGGVPSGSRPVDSHGAGLSLRPAHTDWLRHGLTITGPAEGVDALRGAASGAGIIPWQLDLDRLEEDWFLRLVHPDRRELSLTGARTLAGQLREAVERRQALAVSRVGRSHVCPFDLHALVPVPTTILRLGPDHPDALAWLWQHWGTTDCLRHVVASEPGGNETQAGSAQEGRVLRLSFWSADWTPWQALERIRAEWPLLRFDVRPEYGTS